MPDRAHALAKAVKAKRRVNPARAQERRRQVLEAALVCFRRSGFRGASISEICAEAGMSPGHLYHYFDSKEAIIEAIVEQDRQEAAVLMAELQGRADVLEGICQAAGLAVEPSGFAVDGALTAEIVAEAARNPRVAGILRRFDEGIRQGIVALLREGQRRGQIDPGLDAVAAAGVLQALVDGLAARAVSDPEHDRVGVLAATRTLFERFLAPPGRIGSR